MSATFETFEADFMRPFWQVNAEPVQLARATLGQDEAVSTEEELIGLSEALCGQDEEVLYERIFRRANEVTRCDVPWPHSEALILSIVCHDFLLLADPKQSERKRNARLHPAAALIDSLPVLERLDQVLVRWATLDQLERCIRRDTTVKFWAGTRVFFGRRPPKRIQRLPSLRRVRTSHRDSAINVGKSEALDTFLWRLRQASPLSWLCAAEQWNEHKPRPVDSILIATLREPRLRAYVCETMRERDLGWLAVLRRDATDPLIRCLEAVALELTAMGAAHDSLSAILDTLSASKRKRFSELVQNSVTHSTEHHEHTAQ